jgi:hypothetical protein
MSITEMNPRVADAVRAELVAIGTKNSGLQRHQRRSRGLLLAVGAVVAAGAITGAAIVVNNLPGTTTTAALGAVVSGTYTGTASIELGAAPAGAGAVILDVTCVSNVGRIEVPETPSNFQDADGKTIPNATPDGASWDCAQVSRTVHIADGYLAPGSTSITITAEPGTVWRAAAQYASSVTSEWGVNANGQTYGVDNKKYGMPDLQAAQATNGKVGYAYTKDIFAMEPGSAPVNVYESDGTTIIGQMPVVEAATPCPAPTGPYADDTCGG